MIIIVAIYGKVIEIWQGIIVIRMETWRARGKSSSLRVSIAGASRQIWAAASFTETCSAKIILKAYKLFWLERGARRGGLNMEKWLHDDHKTDIV